MYGSQTIGENGARSEIQFHEVVRDAVLVALCRTKGEDSCMSACVDFDVDVPTNK